MDDARRGVRASHAVAWAACVWAVGCNGLVGNSEHATASDAATSDPSTGDATTSGGSDGGRVMPGGEPDANPTFGGGEAGSGADASGGSDAQGSIPGDASSTEPPSCAAPGTGKSDCGGGAESCCTSLPVPAQTYKRSYDGIEFTDGSHSATISAFRLDRYETTVGRFREFVAAAVNGWAPAAGSGKHAHLNGGQGLVDTGGGYEAGWDPSWPGLPTTASAWTSTLSGTGATWTDTPGSNELLPIGGATWYQAYAFCIWDGGFLPSQAEWNDAAAGGSEQRMYPWSPAFPPGSNAISCADAWYSACAPASPPPLPIAVGSDSPAGDAKWGQADMAGNLFEWTLDWNVNYTDPCTDCADLSPATNTGKVIRGGAVAVSSLAAETSAGVSGGAPTTNLRDVGIRCARTP
jgi:sulfatase modifying factor 1